MPQVRLRSGALLGAMLSSALMWSGIGYAAGIRPVHLGLRHGAVGFVAQVRYQFTGIDPQA